MKPRRRQAAALWIFAGLTIAGCLFAYLAPLQPGAFDAAEWQRFHHHFTGGQGWSIASEGDVTRFRMVDDLQRRHLSKGLRRAQVLQLLGEPEAGGGEEDVYNLVDRPGVLTEALAVRRWGTRDPALYVEYVDGALTRASVR